MALALFVFTHAIWSTDLYDGEAGAERRECGSALSPTRVTEWCAAATDAQRWWGVIFAVLSVATAYGACRLAWGRGFWGVRLEDGDDGD
ncbi:MAG: hypothetical protein AAF548_11260 [Actinomycetota bacterium]